jgi:hypothetical protein
MSHLKLTDPRGKVVLDTTNPAAVTAAIKVIGGAPPEADEDEVLRAAGLTSAEEVEAAKATMGILKGMSAEKRRGVLDQLMSELAKSDEKKKAVASIVDWLDARPSELERPNGSAWHKLLAEFLAKELIVLPDEMAWEEHVAPIFENQPQVFLIEHDWSAAFAGATDYADGEYILPFEMCCFEMRLSGRRLIVVETERGRLIALQAGDLWVVYPPARPDHPMRYAESGQNDHLHALSDLVAKHIRAVCIALEAEVAVSETIRAPHKLNAAREKKGLLPIADYHVVSLARRQRAAPLLRAGEPETGRVRLHFRRGHWRHYETHKTWIKWTLVGNPDLGFINKHYRL